MHISPTIIEAPGGAGKLSQPAMERTDEQFTSVLARMSADGSRTREEAARHAAEEFVGITLVQPILSMLREQGDAAPPFAAGPGEKAFGPLLDAEFALRITRANRFGLVDAVARKLLDKYGSQSEQETQAHVG